MLPHFNYRPVDDLAGRLVRQILPVALIPLLLLLLVQIPAGLSLGRRLRRSEHERVRLLQRDLSASDRKRVRFATALHDGPIEELAGGSYALGAVAATAADRQLPLVNGAQDVVQQSVQDQRGLMTDLDRSDLRSGRLDLTVNALAEQLRVEGIDVELELAELPDLGEEVTATLIGVVRESLANATLPLPARSTSLSPRPDARPGEPARVLLVVADDGEGLDGARVDRNKESCLPIQLLHDRVRSRQGEFVVTSGRGLGTTVRAVLPIGAGNQGTSRT